MTQLEKFVAENDVKISVENDGFTVYYHTFKGYYGKTFTLIFCLNEDGESVGLDMVENNTTCIIEDKQVLLTDFISTIENIYKIFK